MLLLFGTDNFCALVKFLHMLRWVGRLDEVLSFFEKCEAYSPTAATEPGYNYCKGLYYWSVSSRPQCENFSFKLQKMKTVPKQ